MEHARNLELPPYTCPDIDAIIKVIRKSIVDAEVILSSQDLIEIHDKAIDIQYDLADLPDILETLRASNSNLRQAATYYKEAFEQIKP